MATVALVLVGLVAGAYLGWHAGTLWYEWTKPPWGQYGYEFEGLSQNLVGALVGALVCALVVLLVRIRSARAARHRAVPLRGDTDSR